MQRLPDTELPTFVCSRREWRARRAAGFIAAYEVEHGYPPTVREVADALGYSSTNSASASLVTAVQMGLLDHSRGVSRAYSTPRVSVAEVA